MGTEININQYVTAAQFNAGKTSGNRNEKTAKTGGIRKKFSEILHKSETEIEVDSYLPAEIAGMDFEEALSFLLDKVTMAGDNLTDQQEQLRLNKGQPCLFLRLFHSNQ